MGKLTVRSELSAGEIDLLEAAGFEADRDLAKVSPAFLHRELAKANEMLELVDEVPPLDSVTHWVEAAGGDVSAGAEQDSEEEGDDSWDTGADAVVGEAESIVSATLAELEGGGTEEATGLFDYEQTPEVREMLDRAPVALPLPNRELAEAEITPGEIGEAPLLNAAPPDLDVRVVATPGKTRAVAPPDTPRSPRGRRIDKVGRAKEQPARKGIDTERIRHMDETRADPAPAPAVSADSDGGNDPQRERLQLLRTARESTNRGRDPKSRRYIRGVLHDRPVLVWFGSLFMLLFQLVVPVAIVSAPLLILSESHPEALSWVPPWLLAFPVAVPVLGLLCLLYSIRVKCRVCGQKVLLPKHCRKNKKAHHVWGLGYVLPLAFHTLLFRWFNCTFCGTPIRIKE